MSNIKSSIDQSESLQEVLSHSLPITNKIYSNQELLKLSLNEYCFVKPLHIVKIWRRKMHTSEGNKSIPQSPTKIQREPYQLSFFQQAQIRTKLRSSEEKKGNPVNPKILSTLNKLTPTNKPKLQTQLFEIAIQNDQNLQILAEKIFQKACYEKKYTGMWASLCLYLVNQYKGHQERLNSGNSPSKIKNKFKIALLTMCQKQFEDFEITPDSPELLKKKIMGNMGFIGELYKIGIIPPKIIVECLFGLLNLSKIDIDENQIEGATVLLMSCGPKCNKLGESLNSIIETIQKIINDKKVSPRIQFLLLVTHI